MKTVTFLLLLTSELTFHIEALTKPIPPSNPIKISSGNTVFKSRHILKKNQRAKLEFVSRTTGGSEGYRRVYDASANLLIPCSHFKTDGQIVKIHETSICQQPSQVMSFPYKWIAYVNRRHLRNNGHGCRSTSALIQRLFKSGAQAVILSSSLIILDGGTKALQKSGPVVIVDGDVANRIDQVLKIQQKTFVRIKSQQRQPSRQRDTESGNVETEEKNEYLDMGIFMSFFIIVSLVCLAMLIKIKWKQTYLRNTRTKIAVEALQTMQIRHYDITARLRNDDVNSETFNNCAVCLDVLENGKDIRILPCHHEFHVTCIDKWLISNYTCPLCMHSIIGTHKSKSKHRSRNPFCNLHFDKFRNNLSTTTRNPQQPEHEEEEEIRNTLENTQHIEDNSRNVHRQTDQQNRHSSKTTTLVQHYSNHNVTGLQDSKTSREQRVPLLLNCGDTEHACAVKRQNQLHHNGHYRCPFHKTHSTDVSCKQHSKQENKNENSNNLQTNTDACEFLSKSCHDIENDDGPQNTRFLDHKQRRHSFPIETVVFIENEQNVQASKL